MVSPVKKRKLNGSSEPSPKPARNLDFFFRKQTQEVQAGSNDEQEHTSPSGESGLTDEQLARKLQAEWDQDIASNKVTNQTPVTSGVRGPSDSPDKTDFRLDEQAGLNSENRAACESNALNSKPQALREGQNSKTTLSLQAAGSTEDTITSNIPFDESPLTFEPAKYVATLQDLWGPEGGNASYALLTRCFVLINGTQSRIKIVDTLVNLLRVIIEGDPSSLLPTVRIKYYSLPYSGNLYFAVYQI